MFFFQVFTNLCASQNVLTIEKSRFNRAFLNSKTAYRVISVDCIVLTMSATDTFEENANGDSIL